MGTPLKRLTRVSSLLIYLAQLLRSRAYAELAEKVLRMDVRLGGVNALRIEGSNLWFWRRRRARLEVRIKITLLERTFTKRYSISLRSLPCGWHYLT